METFAKNIEQIVDYSKLKLSLLDKYMKYFVGRNVVTNSKVLSFDEWINENLTVVKNRKEVYLLKETVVPAFNEVNELLGNINIEVNFVDDFVNRNPVKLNFET